MTDDKPDTFGNYKGTGLTKEHVERLARGSGVDADALADEIAWRMPTDDTKRVALVLPREPRHSSMIDLAAVPMAGGTPDTFDAGEPARTEAQVSIDQAREAAASISVSALDRGLHKDVVKTREAKHALHLLGYEGDTLGELHEDIKRTAVLGNEVSRELLRQDEGAHMMVPRPQWPVSTHALVNPSGVIVQLGTEAAMGSELARYYGGTGVFASVVAAHPKAKIGDYVLHRERT